MPMEEHSMVLDVALKSKIFTLFKNWVCVREGECNRKNNGSSIAF